MRPDLLLRRLFGTHSQRERARAEALLPAIDRLGATLEGETDRALEARARDLRARARDGVSPDRLLVEAFALTREAARRHLGLRHYDVQVVGGVALHRGQVAEMKTGEGKTLAATLPVALNALSGRGVHVVTVNDYLAARDAEWMRPVYEALGLTVGVVTEDLDPETQREARRAAYAADVTYVTNHELVFDWLRDHLALHPDEVVLRPLHFALVDEVDFLLLDEARTPLIISGPTGDEPALCREARAIVAPLDEGVHYRVDHRLRKVALTDAGWAALEAGAGVPNLADAEHLDWQHALHNALLAHGVYRRDVDYVVEGDKVVLIDEFTGRRAPDKRLADGLHQALEAKEGVRVRAEDQTLARTSYQAFFRRYPKLAGMTGTAYSARKELGETYGLRVVKIPTHRPLIRTDWADVVYRSAPEKWAAVVQEVQELREAGRPVLVGTTSIAESEVLSGHLRAAGVPHEVLNAKNHEAEAAIIAQAGRSGAVTVSTNMAGRGVDILLGGNPEGLLPPEAHSPERLEEVRRTCAADQARVRAAGGLAVIGTGLHEAERIDDQLRGRAGRQGDPGSSQFFLSLDDHVYQKFGRSLRFPEILEALREQLADHPEGTPVTHRRVLATLRELRKKVEVENEAIRREVWRYDMVMEVQRDVIYGWRRQLLEAPDADVLALADALRAELPEDLLAPWRESWQGHRPEAYEALVEEVAVRFALPVTVEDLGPEEAWSPAHARDTLRDWLDEAYVGLSSQIPEADLADLLRQVLLSTIDTLWTEHLAALELLDEAVSLRGYAELDPLVEYRREAGQLFEGLLRRIRLESFTTLFALGAEAEEDETGAPLPFRGIRHPGLRQTVRRTAKR